MMTIWSELIGKLACVVKNETMKGPGCRVIGSLSDFERRLSGELNFGFGHKAGVEHLAAPGTLPPFGLLNATPDSDHSRDPCGPFY